MPAYFLNGALVYFAGYDRHIGFYPGESCLKTFKKELANYKSAVGSVQFPLEETLPMELIKKMPDFKLEKNKKKKK